MAAPDSGEDLDRIVEITRDRLPPDVEEARAAGDAVFGKYILLHSLGHGGTGYVRKAWDTLLGQYVALKFLHRWAQPNVQATTEERIRGLIVEARVASKLRHPHIVPIHDVGHIGDKYYISMEFIDGGSLEGHIQDARGRGWASPLHEEPAHFLGALRDIADAVDFGHAFSPPVVHCDLKPSNVLLNAARSVFVVDFGLARLLEPGQEEDIGIRGTPSYLAPEQLLGRASEVGVFTDVYGFGALLYVLLAGRPMFTGPFDKVLSDVRGTTPERPSVALGAEKERAERLWSSPLLPHLYALEEICLRCVAKRPEDRYPSLARVVEELDGVRDLLRGGSAPPPDPAHALPARASPIAGSEDLLASFRTRLSRHVNASRPAVPDFTGHAPASGTVRILKATPKHLYVLRRGVVLTVPWSELPADRAIELAEGANRAEPEDRLAMAILARSAGRTEESKRLLESLKETPLAEEARRIRDSAAADELL